MTSQLPRFWCLFLSCQQQKNIKNGTAVTSLRSFLFRDDFSRPFGKYTLRKEKSLTIIDVATISRDCDHIPCLVKY